MARQVYLTIQLRGLKDAETFVKAQIAKLKEQRTKALERIARDFYKIEKQWFASAGGGRWRPLSPRYAARKAKRYPGKPILRRTDKMYKEFTGATGHYKISRNTLSIMILGVNYWIAHEEGLHRTPQREVITPWIAGRVDTWNDLVTQDLQVKIITGKR